MTSPFKHFFVCIFSFVAFFVVFVNMLIWSGQSDLGTSVSNTDYFGFQSMLNFVNSWGSSFKYFGNDKYTFAQALSNLVNYSLLNLPKVINRFMELINQGFSLTRLLNFIVEVLFSLLTPFIVFAYGLLCLVWLFVILASFLISVISALAGSYNLHWGSNPPLNPNDYISQVVVHWQNDVAPLITAWGYKGAHITIPLM